MSSSNFTNSIMSKIVADTCAEYNAPPNVTISYSRSVEANGRYSAGTRATASCDQGFQAYPDESISCSFGKWNELVDVFKCVPTDQGELICTSSQRMNISLSRSKLLVEH